MCLASMGGTMSRFLFPVVVVLFTALGAYGQTFRGAINGTVTDASGAAVPGANVTATELATSVAHTTVSTGDGQFSFQDIQPGTYTVTVTAASVRASGSLLAESSPGLQWRCSLRG